MPTQTGPSTLYALAETAIATLVNGAAFVLPANAVRADVTLFIAQAATTAPGTSGSLPPNLISVQGCEDASDDTRWADLAAVSTGTTAAVTTTANGPISAGATSVTLAASGTFGTTSKLLYFRDGSTTGEWVKSQSQSTTTLTVPSPGVVGAHSSGINVYDQALKFQLSFDVSCLKRLRVTVDNCQQGSGPTLAVFAIVIAYAN